jgi:hypothetical protein
VVTTLLDPEAFPRQELAGLYRARWHAMPKSQIGS